MKKKSPTIPIVKKKKTFNSLPYIEDFLLHIQANNYSEKTRIGYERDLLTFDSFLYYDLDNLKFERITKKTIDQFKAYLNSRDRKTANDNQTQQFLDSGSINRMLSSLRRYFSYLIDMDYPAPVAPGSVKLVRAGKKHGQVAELEELTLLIEAPTKYEKNTFVQLRNRAALETLFASGMRISELINLKRNQLDKSGRIFIQGKGKKQRFIYLTDRATKHIEAYLTLRDDALPYLFISKRGSNVNKKECHISPNYLQMKIKWYREMLGINVPTSAHSLRHGYATYLAEQGANPAAIQILLGHESLDTTTRYVHASDKYAEDTHKKFHPLSN
jgi:integrase/recombinase XerD